MRAFLADTGKSSGKVCRHLFTVAFSKMSLTLAPEALVAIKKNQ